MSFFINWMQFIDPVLTRAIAIIPHLREIINIAFKPFNGIDELDNHDYNHLKNRVMNIDEKIHYNEEKPTRSFLLNSENRQNIILGYNLKMKKLEETFILEVVRTVLYHLSSQNEFLLRYEEMPFLLHFEKEMKESLLLPEKEFFIAPIKKSLISNIEKGLDYLLMMHPRRFCSSGQRIEYYKTVEWKGRKQDSSGFPTIENSALLDLIGFSTYTWNLVGLREDLFLTQFYDLGFKSTYMVGFPRACNSFLTTGGSEKVLETVFDKVVVESSLIIRIVQTLSFFDDSLVVYFFPKMPLDNHIFRIKTREKENFDHWKDRVTLF